MQNYNTTVKANGLTQEQEDKLFFELIAKPKDLGNEILYTLNHIRWDRKENKDCTAHWAKLKELEDEREIHMQKVEKAISDGIFEQKDFKVLELFTQRKENEKKEFKQ